MTRSLPSGRLLFCCLVILVLATGAWLRIGGTLSRPLWLDEGYSAFIADHDFGWIWRVVPQFETHPPFYYSLLRLWTLMFGDALAARRALGILVGLATVPVTALGLREVGRLIGWSPSRTRVAMVVGMMLVALAPLTVSMSREVRPYAVLILAHAAAIALLLRIGRISAEERRLPMGLFAWYLIILAVLLWLHNLALLYGAALGLSSLALLMGRGLDRHDWVRFWVGHALVGLAYLPAILILIDQASGWTAATWLKFDPNSLGWDLARLFGTSGRPGLALSTVVGAAGVVLLLRARGGWRVALALTVTALLPILLSILISLVKSPVFLPRTLSGTTLPALMLISIGIAGASGHWRWLAGATLLVMLTLQARASVRDFYQPPSQDWYGVAGWLKGNVRPGDEVWAYPNDAALPLHYAARDRGYADVIAALRPQPTPVPTLDAGSGAAYPTGNRGVVTLSPARLRALVEAASARRVATIWLLRRRRETYDAADDFPSAFAGWNLVDRCEGDLLEIRGYSRVARPEVSREPSRPSQIGRCTVDVTPRR